MYCMIKDMYVYDDIKLFLVQALEIKFYVDHYKSFVVTLNSSDVIAIVYDDFFMHETLSVKKKNETLYIVETCYNNYNHNNYYNIKKIIILL